MEGKREKTDNSATKLMSESAQRLGWEKKLLLTFLLPSKTSG